MSRKLHARRRMILGTLRFGVVVAALGGLALPVAAQTTTGGGDARTFKVAFYNIQSGKGEPGLPGRPVLFVDDSNCTDRTQPMNGWGVNFVQQHLLRDLSDPGIVALGLAEAWACGSPSNVRQLLGWRTNSTERNGTALVARHGFAGPEEWVQLDTSLNLNPVDTMWVLRVPVCLDAGCSASVDIFTTHWYAEKENSIATMRASFDRQAVQTVQFLQRSAARPNILIGDLNTWEGTPVLCEPEPPNVGLNRLRDAGYTDAWPLLHGAAEGFTGMVNRHHCGSPRGSAYKRIDYVWAPPDLLPLAISRFGVVPAGDPAPSDHYGLLAEFPWPGGALSCTYSLSPASTTVSNTGGAGSVELMTQAGCPWSAAALSQGLSVTGPTTGTGRVTLGYTVAAHDGSAPRNLTLRAGGKVLTIVQRGSVVPVLDLNGDGRLDLLWHHQGDGRISGWLMDSTTLADGTLLSPGQVVDTNWKAVGTGDLDGDGQIDIVWQNIADGRTAVWLMDGLRMREATLFSIPRVRDTDWKIRSVGDLNGDGRADLIWQHRGDGRIAAWLMNGVNVLSGVLLTPAQVADTNWRIVGSADFAGNGSRDLVWHHQGDGRVAIWLMNGTTQIGGTLTNPGQVPDTNWKIRSVGDLNTDGYPDLIWQHIGDGRLAAWLMRGLNVIDGILLSPSVVPDTNWHIVGPR